MNPARPPLNERGQIIFERALRILPGLLASSHFTYTAEPEDEYNSDPGVMGENGDENWREFSLRRFNTFAVRQAIELAQELEDAVWLETDPDAFDFCEARAKEFAERDAALKAKRAAIALPKA